MARPKSDLRKAQELIDSLGTPSDVLNVKWTRITRVYRDLILYQLSVYHSITADSYKGLQEALCNRLRLPKTKRELNRISKALTMMEAAGLANYTREPASVALPDSLPAEVASALFWLDRHWRDRMDLDEKPASDSGPESSDAVGNDGSAGQPLPPWNNGTDPIHVQVREKDGAILLLVAAGLGKYVSADTIARWVKEDLNLIDERAALDRKYSDLHASRLQLLQEAAGS